jgi:hypothetical protein
MIIRPADIKHRPHHYKYGRGVDSDTTYLNIIEWDRKKITDDLTELIAHLIKTTDCLADLIAEKITTEVVDKVGTEYSGWGIGSYFRHKFFRYVIAKVMREMLGRINASSDMLPELIDIMTDEAMKMPHVLTAGQKWKIGTNMAFKRHKRYEDVRRRLNTHIRPVFKRALQQSDPFCEHLARMIAKPLVDKAGDYTGGFGLLTDYVRAEAYRRLKEYVQEKITEVLDYIFKPIKMVACGIEIAPKVSKFIMDKIDEEINSYKDKDEPDDKEV